MNTQVYVIMGVAGSGKTTVGKLLADRLGCAFSDADEFHSQENKRKMGAGIALSDTDRMPWLLGMQAAIKNWLADGRTHVLACSALRHAYRDILRPAPGVLFVYLRADRELVARRLAERKHHYMKANMVDSQFSTLEEPGSEEALIIDAAESPMAIVDRIIRCGSGTDSPSVRA